MDRSLLTQSYITYLHLLHPVVPNVQNAVFTADLPPLTLLSQGCPSSAPNSRISFCGSKSHTARRGYFTSSTARRPHCCKGCFERRAGAGTSTRLPARTSVPAAYLKYDEQPRPRLPPLQRAAVCMSLRTSRLHVAYISVVHL